MGIIEKSRRELLIGEAPANAEDASWDEFVSGHHYGHFLQTNVWRNLKQEFGWHGEQVALYTDGGELIAGAMVLFRRRAGLTIAYVPRGPVTNWENQEVTRTLLNRIEAVARQRQAVVLLLEPSLTDTYHHRGLLAAYGLQPSHQTIQPRSTIQIDVAQDEDAILRQMKSKWRYNVRLSKRKEIVVRSASHDDLRHFLDLMEITGERDNFGVHSGAYYARAYELFVPEHGVLLIAEYAGQPLGAIVVVRCGDTAIYLWGASSNQERNRMPNHALQWAGMQWAKEAGARCYDMWGVPDELGSLAVGMRRGVGAHVETQTLPVDLDALPSHDLWGVFRFKQGFGGEVVRMAGAWQRPLHPLGFRAYQLGMAARKAPSLVAVAQDRIRGQIHKGAFRLRTTVSGGTVPLQSLSPNYQLCTIASATEWRTLLGELTEGGDWPAHVLQSWEWGEVKGQTGWRAERFVVRSESGDTVGAFQLLRRQLVPGLPLYYGYVAKGPICDWRDSAQVEMMLSAVQQVAQVLRCIAVKCDPDVHEETEAGRWLRARLEARGWRYSTNQIQFKNTAFSDLCRDEQELLADMKSKWRYNIRLAARRGITIRQGTVTDLGSFYRLYEETSRRDGFLIRPLAYYLTTWQTFLAAQRDADNPTGGALLLAEHAEEDGPVAGIFLLRYGRTCWYFYGASSNRRRRDMPNYLLQWEAMRWAKSQGCVLYDWWGAPTALENESDEMQGVWRFKQGFGADFQPHIGAWDLPLRPVLHYLFNEILPHALRVLRAVKSMGHNASVPALEDH